MQIVKAIFEQNFQDYFRPITEISEDDVNRTPLVISETKVFKFDKLYRTQFKKIFGQDVHLCSVDGIDFKTERICFIEFKSGKLNKNEKWNIRLKASETLIELSQLLNYFNSRYDFKKLMSIRREFILVCKTTDSYDTEVEANLDKIFMENILREKYKGTLYDECNVYDQDTFKRYYLCE